MATETLGAAPLARVERERTPYARTQETHINPRILSDRRKI